MFTVLQRDSLEWLSEQPDESINNVLTGLPDMEELNMTDINIYLEFFRKTAGLIFRKVKKNGYCIFIQTDRKVDGGIIDKSYHLTNVSIDYKKKLIWHKIILQRDIGKVDLHRPTYSHVLCYTTTGKAGVAFPDVFPFIPSSKDKVKNKLYCNATPKNISDKCTEYISKTFKERAINDNEYDIIDPFVGKGTTGISALTFKLKFLGIDIDGKQCEETRKNLGTFSEKINLEVIKD